MQTLLISNGLRISKLNSMPLWSDRLQGVLSECAGFINVTWHVSHSYWDILRIGMTFYDNGTMNAT